MELGTRLRYGMLAMMDLARRGQSIPVRAEDIARSGGLSKGYLEGLLATLRRAGLVRAVRGPGGGWVLARSAARIKPLDIFAALEGPAALVPCVESSALCPTKTTKCRARTLWVAMTRAIEKTLRSDTLASLAGVARKASKKRKPAGTRTNGRKARKAKPKPKLNAKRKPKAKRKAERPAKKRKAAVARNREIVKMVRKASLKRSA